MARYGFSDIRFVFAGTVRDVETVFVVTDELLIFGPNSDVDSLLAMPDAAVVVPLSQVLGVNHGLRGNERAVTLSLFMDDRRTSALEILFGKPLTVRAQTPARLYVSDPASIASTLRAVAFEALEPAAGEAAAVSDEPEPAAAAAVSDAVFDEPEPAAAAAASDYDPSPPSEARWDLPARIPAPSPRSPEPPARVEGPMGAAGARGRTGGGTKRKATKKTSAARAQEKAPPKQRRSKFDTAIESALRSLTRGRIAFDPPKSMRQGTTEKMVVAITRAQDLDDELKEALNRAGDAELADVETGPLMSVELTGEGFKVTDLTPGDQPVGSDDVTSWVFNVFASGHGLLKLHLSVCVKLKVDGLDDLAQRSVSVLEREIDVSVSPAYVTKSFVGRQWKWLFGLPALVAGGIAAWEKVLK
jgi:hypothetical protein